MANPPAIANSDDVLNLAETAAYLRVSEDTLRKLAETKEIPARKVGKEWRFLKSALNNWLGLGAIGDQPLSATAWFLDEAAFKALVTTIEDRLRAKMGANEQNVPPPGSKERVLQVAGLLRDDPTIDEFLHQVYLQRGRPMIEETE